MILVVKPGLLDVVMDLGRPGFRAQGVPEGGAADAAALIRANRLVGNPDDAAGLEMTWTGPELSFPDGATLAMAGADMGARLDGVPLERGRQYMIKPGASLRMGQSVAGMRAYLAVAGGVDVPLTLGSRSTFLPGGWGGWQGRALQAGDQLPVGAGSSNRTWEQVPDPEIRADPALRVLAGPQLGGFTDVSLADFLQKRFIVHQDSNRLGIRLSGPALKYEKDELASQAVLPGAIQVPPNGQPIILGWDGPVTGGYPVIAGVIASDLPRLAQLKPGDQVQFRIVNHDEALTAWRRAATWTV